MPDISLLPAHLKCWRYHPIEGARIFVAETAPGEAEGWFKNPAFLSEESPKEEPKRGPGRPRKS